MATVFLSYDRDDADHARQVAQALEKAGHSVWWDLHVRGGAQFSKAIEEALDGADVVVVLWSANSVESAWVRDEASVGRDTGRLVPVTIDGTQPPLGFRQFHTLDLSGRDGPHQLESLFDAVESTGTREAPVSTKTAPKRVRTNFRLGRKRNPWLMFGLLALVLGLLILLLGLIVSRPWEAKGSVAVVAIRPADPNPDSRALARDLLAQLGQLQSAKPDALELVGADARNRASLVFEVAAAAEEQKARANLVLLDGKKGGLLWSKAFERPVNETGDLRQQLGYTAARVLECAVEAHSGGRAALKSETLKLYLNGCAGFAGGDDQSLPNLIPVFRRVIAAAPEFEGAWAKLLLAEDDAYLALTDTESRFARDLKRDIAAARKVNAELPEAYLAEADLLPFNAYGGRLSLINRAVAADPASSTPLSSRSGALFAVGRISDALNDAKRAAELNPISPRIRNGYIFTLAQSGRTQAALDEIAKSERIWPRSSFITSAKFAIHLRFGDPRIAWEMIQSGQTEANWSGAENFLKARLSHRPDDIERAIKDARAFYQDDHDTFQHLVQTLSILDREDDLLKLLMTVPMEYAAEVTDVTFRPAARELWRNPKSLEYAKRVGLLQYWQSSGKWPDFCLGRDLPYDCKKEAAKLSA